MVGRHHELRALAGREIGPEVMRASIVPVGADGDDERRAGVPVPGLGGIDAVPLRNLADIEQKEDGGGGRAAVDLARVAKSLAIPAALGVRLQLQEGLDLGGGQWAGLIQ